METARASVGRASEMCTVEREGRRLMSFTHLSTNISPGAAASDRRSTPFPPPPAAERRASALASGGAGLGAGVGRWPFTV